MADEDGGEEVKLDKRGLPPIGRIKMPEGIKITSTKIRWLDSVGYMAREIAPYLGCRYQQVRNVLGNPPKRMAREDVPPPIVEILAISDDNLELMDQHAFQQEMAASSTEHLRERKGTNKARRQLREAALTEDDAGNEALDDENYRSE